MANLVDNIRNKDHIPTTYVMNGKQLKNSILQWAIQGKLVPQDPNDEPASVLLDKIRQEKERLIKEKKSSVTGTHLLSIVVRTILVSPFNTYISEA